MHGLDRDAARALLDRPDLARLLGVLDGGGEETRIVGGAIRNALIGRAVTEIDLATTALPAVTTERARRAGFKPVPTGIAHGTVTVVVDGAPFEVTTLREDVETDGRHATVRFGRDFDADARRRDFTVNALSMGRDGTIHDATGGLDDLAARRLRFIGEARQRIREDYLRTLRFFRFHAEYAAGPIDPDGFDAAIRERHGLDQLSRERVRAELMKLVVARRSVETLGLLSGSGILARVTGGVADVGRLARAEGLDAIGRLAAVLVGVREDAARLRERLRLSNDEHDRLDAYAQASGRLRSSAVVDAAELRRVAFLHGLDALLDAAAALAGEVRPVLDPGARDLLARYREGREVAPIFPLSGRDLVAEGVPPGPEIGRRLAQARMAWLAAGCPEIWPIRMPQPVVGTESFGWHETKHLQSLDERGFGFDTAALVFDDETLEFIDDRYDYGEIRIRAVGQVGGVVLTVVYTDRGTTRWIISARRANRRERTQWRARYSR